MTEGFINIINDVNTSDAEIFEAQTKTNLTAKNYVEKITVDFSWVDKIYEAIPYIDNIVRNPKKFIVQEEEVIRIEKVKKITEDSIKHLAQNTNLIQDVDKDGTIKPLKLLNTFREETIDLYENRFIYSLENNLYSFIQNQLVYEDEESFLKEIKTVNYKAKTKLKEEDISFELSLRSANYENLTVQGEKATEIKEKIEYIKEILEDFMSGTFMKTMKNATPVRSPIRRTNIILKDTDYIYALKLWEFLESFNVETPLKKYKETLDLSSTALDKNYFLTYYLNYHFLNTRKSGKIKEEGKYYGIKKLIFDIAKDYDSNIPEIRKMLNEELKLATEFKQKELSSITSSYKSFINDHNNRMKDALFILK